WAVIKIADEELARWTAGDGSLGLALKNFAIRIGAKTGFAFAFKKTGILIASCFWGATATLGIGAILFFAGLLVGTKIGERLTHLAFEAARKALSAHQMRMNVMVESNARKALQEIRVA